ncbi:MAG: SDR family oxidoreductase, partial [Candidatus Omnitrophota bacterium]
MNNVLLTGATGFLGSFLARELLDRGYRIFALARGKGEKSAKERVHDALRFVYEKEWKARFISDNVEVIEGDITSAGLGIKREVAARLKSETDIIIHSAALAELRVPLQKIRK